MNRLVAGAVVVLAATLLVCPAAAAPRTFEVVPGESEVIFHTSAPTDWDITGKSTKLTGSITVDPDSPSSTVEASISLPTQSLHSDNELRDQHMHDNALESETYPKIVVIVESATTEADTLVESEPATFTVRGTLRLHGQTRDVEYPATVMLQDETLVAEGKTELLMSDYGITPPRLAYFIKVRDRTVIEFRVVAKAQSEAHAADAAISADGRAGTECRSCARAASVPVYGACR